MRKLLLISVTLLYGAAPPAVKLPTDPAHWCGDPVEAPEHPQIMKGYGGGGFAIQTKAPEAQAYFNNGMQLAHAFAHKAAIAAFQEARRLDPACAMCAWGEAWSAGPTINYGIGADDRKKLAEIVDTAEKLSAGGPANEKALIGALKARYADDKGNRAFAEKMDALASANPADDEISVLAADALMIDSNYQASKMPRPVALLEAVLKRNPDYTPAIHFYIHATELAGYPDRATPYADRLATLAPAASHLVHMPAHTYFWIGRYADAATANVRAVEISDENAKRQKLKEPDGRWALNYYGHNVSFGLIGALMAGDAQSGITLARPVIAMAARTGRLDDGREYPVGRAYVAEAILAPPSEMLSIADPGGANPSARQLWHYGRGEALARLGDAKGVLQEADAVLKDPKPGGNMMDQQIGRVAKLVLEGRAAMLRNRPADAAKIFAKAAAIEEANPLAVTSDPPAWWYPVRRDVAAALLADGKPELALAAADASLKRRSHDAVALSIRAKAEERLNSNGAAKLDRQAALGSWRGDRRAIS